MTEPRDKDAVPRARDREGTERIILESAKALIAREGYAAFGVNAVAREAGCDKQLIYRYFGGTDGLIAAIGDEAARWVEATLNDIRPAPGAAYSEVLIACLEALLDALRKDALMRQLIGLELTGSGDALRNMARARTAALGARVLPLFRAAMQPAAGIDSPAINALLIGAMQHAVMSGAAQSNFIGMPLEKDEDWERLKAGLRALVEGVYG